MKLISIFSLLIAALITLPTLKAEDTTIDPDWSPPMTTLTLQWSPNAEPDIAGYVVYYGLHSGIYTRSQTVDDPSATILVPTRFTVYVAVTAFNTAGEESPYSEEVHWP